VTDETGSTGTALSPDPKADKVLVTPRVPASPDKSDALIAASVAPSLGGTAPNPPGPCAAEVRWATARNVVETIYHCLLILAVVLGLFFGLPILQAEYARAQRDETVAKAEIARREAKEKEILDLELSATRLGRPEDGRYILVTLDIKNTGNKLISIPAKRLTGSIARIRDIDEKGQPEFANAYDIRFSESPDQLGSRMEINPGERARMQAVQKLQDPTGVYQISVRVGAEGDESNSYYPAILFAHFE